MEKNKFGVLAFLKKLGEDILLLGEYIKKSRKEHKISQRELAKLIGTSNTFISKLEKGEIQKPNPSLLNKIIYELDLSYFEAMELAGYLSKKMTSRAGEEFITSQRNEWLSNKKDIKEVKLDFKLYNSLFDVVLTNSDDEKEYLKIIARHADKNYLEQEIKLLALDIIISNGNQKSILNVIYPKSQIAPGDYNEFLGINNSISYIPLQINLCFK